MQQQCTSSYQISWWLAVDINKDISRHFSYQPEAIKPSSRDHIYQNEIGSSTEMSTEMISAFPHPSVVIREGWPIPRIFHCRSSLYTGDCALH